MAPPCNGRDCSQCGPPHVSVWPRCAGPVPTVQALRAAMAAGCYMTVDSAAYWPAGLLYSMNTADHRPAVRQTALLDDLRAWISIEINLYGLSPGHVGFQRHGVKDWIARAVINWAHHSTVHTAATGRDRRVHRRLRYNLDDRHGTRTLDLVLPRRGSRDIAISIADDDKRGDAAQLAAIEYAAAAGANAFWITWRRGGQPAAGVSLIDLSDAIR